MTIQTICPYFGKCGGCSYQDIPYPEQLERKRKHLEELIKFDDIKVFSGKEYYYRNRMDFVFHADGVGLREKGSWQSMVDISKCIISNENLNNLLAEVRDFFEGVFYFDVKKRFGTYCYAVIRTPNLDSSVSIVINKKSKRTEEAVQKVTEFSRITQANNVILTYVPHNRNVSISDEYQILKGNDLLRTRQLGKDFHFPVQGFFQVNDEMTEKVYAYCQELLSAYKNGYAHLLDLYGGVGTFGILNSRLFQTVTVIENYEPSVSAAEQNKDENDIKNMRLLSRDARHLKDVLLPHPLFIIVDPPRSGMHPRALQQIKELNPEVLIYVSCNPKHLANDLQILDKFKIKSVAMFDMFPQTPHMEAVIELTRLNHS